MAEIGMQTDFEQEQNNANLGEQTEDGIRLDPAQQGRADKDAGEQLTKNRWDIIASRNLSKQAGGDQHDRDD